MQTVLFLVLFAFNYNLHGLFKLSLYPFIKAFIKVLYLRFIIIYEQLYIAYSLYFIFIYEYFVQLIHYTLFQLV